ncbi:Cro/CI family transcriptional regulator [Pseudomonas aeruginosa]|uniref:Cro/CI family transcriptional regulator n=1 Tax=Pseudomonas aeruginosa TaxID=287 RepID=UPI001E473A36|nr:Cro/CI family transcriptional regulator [Pseudomonas aeruginosa]UGR44425.1 Cro/CI family transcriptional regulator [Pseudomonas aeruginosa]
MRRITIHDFADEKGQIEAAALLGIRQSSLSKALRVGREIYVIERDDGSYSAEEIKPFPSQAAKAVA